ncbi:hypothetical protein NH340_JMT05252 [Sarcoptes scabiei]|nr:hypothetical protein NH340_JMT05252 [Sarcoptes scabiei]
MLKLLLSSLLFVMLIDDEMMQQKLSDGFDNQSHYDIDQDGVSNINEDRLGEIGFFENTTEQPDDSKDQDDQRKIVQSLAKTTIPSYYTQTPTTTTISVSAPTLSIHQNHTSNGTKSIQSLKSAVDKFTSDVAERLEQATKSGDALKEKILKHLSKMNRSEPVKNQKLTNEPMISIKKEEQMNSTKKSLKIENPTNKIGADANETIISEKRFRQAGDPHRHLFERDEHKSNKNSSNHSEPSVPKPNGFDSLHQHRQSFIILIVAIASLLSIAFESKSFHILL